mgnify:CR=1 FL=1
MFRPLQHYIRICMYVISIRNFAIVIGNFHQAGYQKLQAKIPLKELSNYSISLSSLTGGRASFTTKFASYELVPNDLQQKLIEEHAAEAEDEE